MPEPEKIYSEMTERELLEHLARNSDQSIGFLTGLSTVIREMKETFDKLKKRFPLLRI